ncbi:MAG: FAD-binding protein [Acidiferrobacterales bacterium]|nr:FAD-binding protein [Acidiferrobacterales bacterium]
MSVLVLIEHDNSEVKSSTLNTVTAATQLGSDIHGLVVGYDCADVVSTASKIGGISKIVSVDSPEYQFGLVENVAPVVKEIASGYSHVLAPASTFGKNLLPRVAAMLDVQQISDISEIVSEDTYIRPIYAGNALAKVQSTDAVKLITIRTTTFDPAAEDSGSSAPVEQLSAQGDEQLSNFIKHDLTRSERPELTTASIVISGGRGMQSGENFIMLEQVADKLGAAVGASRAAVDAGYVPNDYQVGQTGKVVAPDLYLAVGISGAIQHLAGMKDSKVIVAINKDEEAPIFQVADFGWVADLFTAIPELESALE